MHTLKRFFPLFLAAAAAMLLGCASTETQQSTGEYIDDAAITAKVKTALIRDDMVDAADINIETFRGTVQLSGFVDNEDELEKAEDIAEGVEGVVRVRNDLRIKSEY